MIFNGDNYSRGLARRGRAPRAAQPRHGGREPPGHDLAQVGQAVREVRRLQRARASFAVTRSYVEGYTKTINIEIQLTIQIAKRMILPAALRYQDGSRQVDRQPQGHRRDRSQGPGGSSERARRRRSTSFRRPPTHSSEAIGRAPRRRLAGPRQARPRRDHPRHERRPRGRRPARSCLVADDLWPLPTYQEMLFLK